MFKRLMFWQINGWWLLLLNKVVFKSDSYSACVVYTKTIIHLSVDNFDNLLINKYTKHKLK